MKFAAFLLVLINGYKTYASVILAVVTGLGMILSKNYGGGLGDLPGADPHLRCYEHRRIEACRVQARVLLQGGPEARCGRWHLPQQHGRGY